MTFCGRPSLNSRASWLPGFVPANCYNPDAGIQSAFLFIEFGTDDMAEKITDSGLKYEDLVEGNGAVAEAGQTVTVHYTGWLTDGSKFDSSLDRNQPFQFLLGKGQVIRGWDEGVQGMKIGGKRKLTIPPQLGYGAAGAGGVIPANATLVFDVELLELS